MMKTKRIRQYPAMTAVVFFVVFAALARASMASDGADKTEARRIHRHCKSCVFTVNAYSPLEDTDERAAGGKTWQCNVGTAIPMDEDGYLLTLRSVVDKARKIKIINSDGKKAEAELVGNDHTGRISILKIDPSFITHRPEIASLNNLSDGEDVYFLGVVPGMSVDVTDARVNRIRRNDGTIELSSSGVPGTSGTPVFDSSERVLGMLAFQVYDDANPNASEEKTYIAISLEHALVLAHNTLNAMKPKCGWLGVCIDLTTASGEGLLITDVIDGSPASTSRIMPRDRIFEFNGVPVATPHQFSEAFSRTHSGDTVTLKVLRDGEEISIDVTLTDRR